MKEKHWVDYTALLVAAMSFLLTYCESNAIRRHYRLSVVPQLIVEAVSSEQDGYVEVKIVNYGLGPARIVDSALLNDSGPAQPLKEGLQKMGNVLQDKYSWIVLEKSGWFPNPSFLRPGEEKTIARFSIEDYEQTAKTDANKARANFVDLKKLIARYGAQVSFKSLYDEEKTCRTTRWFRDCLWDDDK